jgi:predicted acetyltransferase
MVTELVGALPGDRATIATLLDEYLRELAGHREVPVGAAEASSYPYLDAYFCEPGRHAFLIRHGGKIVGFALIRAPESTGRVWEVAEFFVEPGSRRVGVGRDAIALVWRRLAGDWEVQVHARNSAAIRFWSSCVDEVAHEKPTMTEVGSSDGKRVQFNFHVHRRTAG